MNNPLLTWAQASFQTKGILVQEIKKVLDTPWSAVYSIKTNNALYYLKQTPKDLYIEAKILEKLSFHFPSDCPNLIAYNDQLLCFITKDAGISLRQYLHKSLELDLLYQGLEQFIHLQIAAQTLVNEFFDIGVPDWRLEKFEGLFQDLLGDKSLLEGEGIGEEAQLALKQLLPKLAYQCQQLSDLNIPQTLVQTDCHTNNMLIDPRTQKLCFVDLGELVISHPLFSVHNYLLQALKHHLIGDEAYQKLLNICQKYWPKFDEAYPIIKVIFPVYSALSCYRLMKSIDIEAFYQFYPHQHKLGASLLEYLQNA